jgi:hypothetical protein
MRVNQRGRSAKPSRAEICLSSALDVMVVVTVVVPVCVSCGAHPSYWLVGVVAHLHVDTDFDSPDRQTERCLARAVDVRKGEASEFFFGSLGLIN